MFDKMIDDSNYLEYYDYKRNLDYLNSIKDKIESYKYKLEEIGNTALYFASDLSNAVTSEIHYVDCGFNIIGMPKTVCTRALMPNSAQRANK